MCAHNLGSQRASIKCFVLGKQTPKSTGEVLELDRIIWTCTLSKGFSTLLLGKFIIESTYQNYVIFSADIYHMASWQIAMHVI